MNVRSCPMGSPGGGRVKLPPRTRVEYWIRAWLVTGSWIHQTATALPSCAIATCGTSPLFPASEMTWSGDHTTSAEAGAALAAKATTDAATSVQKERPRDP